MLLLVEITAFRQESKSWQRTIENQVLVIFDPTYSNQQIKKKPFDQHQSFYQKHVLLAMLCNTVLQKCGYANTLVLRQSSSIVLKLL